MTPTELLAKLEAATGPDEYLDGCLDGLVGHENEQWPPSYTKSIDAAVTLCEQVLPGWIWTYDSEQMFACVGNPMIEETAEGPPALALCTAVLRAHIAQEADDEPDT